MNPEPAPKSSPTSSTRLSTTSRAVRPESPRRRLATSTESTASGATLLLRAWQQWWKIAIPSGMALAVLLCLLVMMFFVPKYRATAYLILSRERSPVQRDSESEVAADAWVKTQVELMRSSVILSEVLGEDGISEIQELAEQDDPVAWLARNLTITAANKSDLHQVEFSSRSPEASQKIVNAIVNTYIKRHDKDYDSFSKSVSGRLKTALETRLLEVSKLQKDLVALAKQLGAADPFLRDSTTSSAELSSPASQLRTRFAEAEVACERISAELKALESLQSENQPTQAEDAIISLDVDASPAVVDAKKFVAAARAALTEIESRSAKGAAGNAAYAQGERRLHEAEAKVAELRKQLKDEYAQRRAADRRAKYQERIGELQRQLSIAQSAKNLLKERTDTENKKLIVSGGDSAQLELVRTELAREEKIVDLIGSSKLFLDAGLGSGARIDVQKKADLPLEPIESRPYKFLAVASLLGMVLPFGAALLWERLVRRIGDVDQLAQDSALDVVGEIAQLPSRPVLMRGAGQRRFARDVGTYQESVDSLQTCLMLSEKARDTHAIAITSAISGEGKTSLTTQLATSISRSLGVRLLVIDGDMRSPAIHATMRVKQTPGLAEVLSGKSTLDQAVVHAGNGRFDVLPAGTLGATPHQLIGGKSFAALIEKARESYDYILIDTPPILCASESLMIAKAADGVLLCALCEVSRSRQVRSAAERLTRAGANVLGAVLSGTPLSQYSRRYGGYGYSSQYALATARFATNLAGDPLTVDDADGGTNKPR